MVPPRSTGAADRRSPRMIGIEALDCTLEEEERLHHYHRCLDTITLEEVSAGQRVAIFFKSIGRWLEKLFQ